MKKLLLILFIFVGTVTYAAVPTKFVATHATFSIFDTGWQEWYELKEIFVIEFDLDNHEVSTSDNVYRIVSTPKKSKIDGGYKYSFYTKDLHLKNVLIQVLFIKDETFVYFIEKDMQYGYRVI